MAALGSRSKTVDLPRMSRAASVLPGTLNEETRTVDVVWTTGAAVLRGFYDQYWEELSLEPKHVRLRRLNNGAPFLNSHNSYDANDVVGVVVAGTASLESKRGIATIRFARAEDDPEADKIFRKVKDGILQNISVGYATFKMEEVAAGKDKIKRFLATDWEPHELSVVPMGADDGAGFRSANADDNARTPCVFFTRHQETPMKDDEIPTPAPTESHAAAAAAHAAAVTRAAVGSKIENAKAIAEASHAAAEEATTAERFRVATIRKLSKDTGLGDDWAQKLIEAGTTVEVARDVAFRHMVKADEDSPIDGSIRINAGDDARDKFIRGASAWMFDRTGTRALVEAAAKKAPESFKGVAFDPGEFRGYSPVELARLSLERAGVKTRGLDKMTLIGQAFTHRSGYQTTSDFSTMLENVMGKVLLGAYVTQENTYELFCGTDQVPDFRTSNRYRTGSVPSLDDIAEHGEYKSGVIPDAAKYPLSTGRKGKIFALSREALVNDDMGALTNLAQEYGRSSGRTIENAVYALLALNSGLGPTQSDSQPFFHANRLNVNATGSALSVAGLDADRVVMRAQKDPNSLDYLSISPSILVVPDSLYGTALVINDSQYDPDTANKLQKPNMVRGLFKQIVGTPLLSAASTRRYLFADPAVTPAIVIAYLEGYSRGPILESQNGWRIDGVEWKVTLYAKAQMGDTKGAVTNAGV
jgi:HK97 family phage prohead protease